MDIVVWVVWVMGFAVKAVIGPSDYKKNPGKYDNSTPYFLKWLTWPVSLPIVGTWYLADRAIKQISH